MLYVTERAGIRSSYHQFSHIAHQNDRKAQRSTFHSQKIRCLLKQHRTLDNKSCCHCIILVCNWNMHSFLRLSRSPSCNTLLMCVCVQQDFILTFFWCHSHLRTKFIAFNETIIFHNGKNTHISSFLFQLKCTPFRLSAAVGLVTNLNE